MTPIAKDLARAIIATSSRSVTPLTDDQVASVANAAELDANTEVKGHIKSKDENTPISAAAIKEIVEASSGTTKILGEDTLNELADAARWDQGELRAEYEDAVRQNADGHGGFTFGKVP